MRAQNAFQMEPQGLLGRSWGRLVRVWRIWEEGVFCSLTKLCLLGSYWIGNTAWNLRRLRGGFRPALGILVDPRIEDNEAVGLNINSEKSKITLHVKNVKKIVKKITKITKESYKNVNKIKMISNHQENHPKHRQWHKNDNNWSTIHQK